MLAHIFFPTCVVFFLKRPGSSTECEAYLYFLCLPYNLKVNIAFSVFNTSVSVSLWRNAGVRVKTKQITKKIYIYRYYITCCKTLFMLLKLFYLKKILQDNYHVTFNTNVINSVIFLCGVLFHFRHPPHSKKYFYTQRGSRIVFMWEISHWKS